MVRYKNGQYWTKCFPNIYFLRKKTFGEYQTMFEYKYMFPFIPVRLHTGQVRYLDYVIIYSWYSGGLKLDLKYIK